MVEMKMASLPTEIVPELLMPPPALDEPNTPILVTLMPFWFAESMLALLMPPAKLETPVT